MPLVRLTAGGEEVMGQSIPDMPPRRDPRTLFRLSRHLGTTPDVLRREMTPDEIAVWAACMNANDASTDNGSFYGGASDCGGGVE